MICSFKRKNQTKNKTKRVLKNVWPLFFFSLFSPFGPLKHPIVVVFFFSRLNRRRRSPCRWFPPPNFSAPWRGTTKKIDNSHGGTEFQHSTEFAVGFGLDGLGVSYNPKNIYQGRKNIIFEYFGDLTLNDMIYDDLR